MSWDEALDFIVKRMRAVGPEAVGLWAGYVGFTPGSAVTIQMMQRFSNMYGYQNWHPAMICWGLGGFGVGLTALAVMHIIITERLYDPAFVEAHTAGFD